MEIYFSLQAYATRDARTTTWPPKQSLAVSPPWLDQTSTQLSMQLGSVAQRMAWLGTAGGAYCTCSAVRGIRPHPMAQGHFTPRVSGRQQTIAAPLVAAESLAPLHGAGQGTRHDRAADGQHRIRALLDRDVMQYASKFNMPVLRRFDASSRPSRFPLSSTRQHVHQHVHHHVQCETWGRRSD